jgi:serine protease AprX
VKFPKSITFSIFIFLIFSLLQGFYIATGELNEDVVSLSLIEKMNLPQQEETYNLIVQFEGEVTEDDLRILMALNFEIIQVFHIIPAVHVYGKKDSIISLSNYERTYWIETNDRLHYNLEVSTSVINATQTWNRVITNFDREKDPIDGTGVTVVVADTGIDTTHPDLDYHEKVIKNLKKDVDHPGRWKEMENTDTFFGHGTHCAGIVGGTGEGSGGMRKGVAPGVSLIGLSIGDPWETNEVGGLEWVYENSRPNANPDNIRVVSNSWGYEDFDESFKNAVMEATRRLTYDNNVVVVFAASNDGEEDHDGHVSTTNMYGNVPVAISVAAAQRDGMGMADFSSRGYREENETWPDITAPGVSIWSARDSAGLMGRGNNENPYYIPASGTSMATPHIAGVVALLFQAAPSLNVSNVHDDFTTQDSPHWQDMETRIHEAEYIMEVTADFMTEGEGLADNFSISLEGRPHDYAQGYGLVNVERAVGLALTLEELRKDKPETTVHDALKSYLNIINDTTKKEETDVLVASWMGEYSLHNDQNDVPMYTTSQTRYVFISNESEKLIVDLSFPPIDLEDNTVGSVAVTLDYDDDQNVDWSGELFDENTLDGQRHDEIDISGGEFASHKGKLWTFSIYGYAVSTLRNPRNPTIPVVRSFRAPTIEYFTSVQQVLDVQGSDNIFVDYRDFRSVVVQLGFGEPTQEYEEGTIKLNTYEYNLSRIVEIEEDKPRIDRDDAWLIALIVGIAVAFVVVGALVRKMLKENKIETKISTKRY